MKKKYFKNNESYFKYIHKNKDLIDIINVKPIMKKFTKSQICLFYERRKSAV